MNLVELSSLVAAKARLTKSQAEEVTRTVFSLVAEALKEGEQVKIAGFGTFEVRDRKEKQSKNPQTGETITVPAKKAPAFKAGKALKDAVNA